jgi:SAM-dependent methyltransferase
MKYVLEHLPDPGAALARVADLVAPGGALLFSVPNTESPGRRLKGERWFAYQDRTHVSLLDPSTWRRLAADAGLVLEREWSDGLWDVPYVRGVPAWLQLPVFAAPAIAEVLVGGTFLPVGWGENLLVLARRR